MDPLIWLSWLRQRRQECRSWTVIISANLAFVTGFQVLTNVGIHARPIVTLKNAFFCLVNAVMAGEEVTVGFLKDIIDQSLGQEDDHTAWFELSFDSSPHNVIVNKALAKF
jgi:hypothetical protein